MIECDLRASEIAKDRIYLACLICLRLFLLDSHKALSNQTWRGFISLDSRMALYAWLGFISFGIRMSLSARLACMLN